MRIKGIAITLISALVLSVFVSSLSAQSYLYIDERMALVHDKIEAGAARGSLTKNEQGRLKTRYFVLKSKSDRYKKHGTTQSQYIQLERELTALEKDTDRLLGSLKRK